MLGGAVHVLRQGLLGMLGRAYRSHWVREQAWSC